MNGWLLDTNVIAEMSGAKPDPKVAKWFNAQVERSLFLSILTIAEYQKGIEHLLPGDKLRPRLQRAVIALEGRFSGRILSVSDQIVLRWGAISGEVVAGRQMLDAFLVFGDGEDTENSDGSAWALKPLLPL